MSLGISVNKNKNGVLLAYISNKIPNINLRKLLKIVYLLDEHFMELRGFPLTWFDYFAWKKGPVAPEVYDIKNGAFQEYINVSLNDKGQRIINSNERHEFLIYKQMGDFSQSELSEVDAVIEKYKDKTSDELTSLTHVPDSLWSRIVTANHIDFSNNSKSDYEIPLTLLFSQDDYRNEVYEDALWDMEFQDMLNHKRNNTNV